MARVSIIIPTRNRAAMLRHAIDSAQNAGKDVEVIVVDDASTDDTQAMCRELDGITYIRMDKNIGLARARNMGISRSSGDFVAFLDDDDLRTAGSIDRQVDMLAKDQSLSFVYGQVLVGDPQRCEPTGEVRPSHCPMGDLFWKLLEGNFIYVPSVVVQKRTFEELGLFATDVPGTEDWDAWIRLSEKHNVGAVDQAVAIYRDFSRTSGSMSSNRPKMWRSSLKTLANALNRERATKVEPSVREALRSNLLNCLWDELISEGRAALSAGNVRYAIRSYVTAFWSHPAKLMNRGPITGLSAICSRTGGIRR